jgi:hypothetical protein
MGHEGIDIERFTNFLSLRGIIHATGLALPNDLGFGRSLQFALSRGLCWLPRGFFRGNSHTCIIRKWMPVLKTIAA